MTSVSRFAINGAYASQRDLAFGREVFDAALKRELQEVNSADKAEASQFKRPPDLGALVRCSEAGTFRFFIHRKR